MMTQKCGILRNQADMSGAEYWVSSYLTRLDAVDLMGKKQVETLNLLQVSSEVLKASMARKKASAHIIALT